MLLFSSILSVTLFNILQGLFSIDPRTSTLPEFIWILPAQVRYENPTNNSFDINTSILFSNTLYFIFSYCFAAFSTENTSPLKILFVGLFSTALVGLSVKMVLYVPSSNSISPIQASIAIYLSIFTWIIFPCAIARILSALPSPPPPAKQDPPNTEQGGS